MLFAAKKKFSRISLSNLNQLIWSMIRFVIIFGLCFTIICPLFVKALQSVMDQKDILDITVKLYPKQFSLKTVNECIKMIKYPSALAYTFVLSLIVSLLQLLICCMAGYGFARFQFRFKGAIFACVLVILMVPPNVYGSAMFIYFKEFLFGAVNLIGTPWPYLILSVTGMGFKNGLYIYVMRQLYRGMPKELEEAAYVDGYDRFQTFFRIMIPMGKNMMLTVFVLSFCWQWTDVFYAQIFRDMKTLSTSILTGVVNFPSSGVRLDQIMISVYRNAACVLAIIPLLVLFGFTQKRLTESIERSGLVG